MLVPVKKKSGKLKKGVVRFEGITVKFSNVEGGGPFIKLDNMSFDGGAYVSMTAARQLEKLFGNLAAVLSGKPQQD